MSSHDNPKWVTRLRETLIIFCFVLLAIAVIAIPGAPVHFSVGIALLALIVAAVIGLLIAVEKKNGPGANGPQKSGSE